MKTDVLIVGGGPVGLALAMELNHHGIRSVIIDPRLEVTMFRKANGCNARTFEHFRRWGVAEEVRREAPLPGDWSDDILFMTSFTGYELGRLAGAKHGVGRMNESPETFQRVPQWIIERTLRRKLEENALTTTRWGVKLVRHEPGDGEHSVATVVDSDGIESTIDARYVIGCDGTRSTVRSDIGVALDDETTYSLNANITMKCPELGGLHGKSRAVHYWYMNEDVSGHFSPQDLSGTWLLTSTWLAEDKEPDLDALIRRAVGTPVEYTIVDSSVWWANSYLAREYRKGNSFLCGDAIHVHPPSGGYGMNQGVQDAVDLGWKLSATLSGWGSDGLLDSYELERKPVNRWFVAEAVDSWRRTGRQLAEPGLEAEGRDNDLLRDRIGREICASRAKQFDALGIIFGYQYENSPIVVDDGTEVILSTVSHYAPTARPGARAPHAWLEDGSSLFDHFGREFTLLDLGSDSADVDSLVHSAEELKIPLTVLRVHSETLQELYGSDLILIRPDQHVAWRRMDAKEQLDPQAILSTVVGRVASLAG